MRTQLCGARIVLRTLAINNTPLEWLMSMSAIDRIRVAGRDKYFGSYLFSIVGDEESSRRTVMSELIKKLGILGSRNGSLQGRPHGT